MAAPAGPRPSDGLRILDYRNTKLLLQYVLSRINDDEKTPYKFPRGDDMRSIVNMAREIIQQFIWRWAESAYLVVMASWIGDEYRRKKRSRPKKSGLPPYSIPKPLTMSRWKKTFQEDHFQAAMQIWRHAFGQPQLIMFVRGPRAADEAGWSKLETEVATYLDGTNPKEEYPNANAKARDNQESYAKLETAIVFATEELEEARKRSPMQLKAIADAKQAVANAQSPEQKTKATRQLLEAETVNLLEEVTALKRLRELYLQLEEYRHLQQRFNRQKEMQVGKVRGKDRRDTERKQLTKRKELRTASITSQLTDEDAYDHFQWYSLGLLKKKRAEFRKAQAAKANPTRTGGLTKSEQKKFQRDFGLPAEHIQKLIRLGSVRTEPPNERYIEEVTKLEEEDARLLRRLHDPNDTKMNTRMAEQAEKNKISVEDQRKRAIRALLRTGISDPNQAGRRRPRRRDEIIQEDFVMKIDGPKDEGISLTKSAIKRHETRGVYGIVRQGVRAMLTGLLKEAISYEENTAARAQIPNPHVISKPSFSSSITRLVHKERAVV